MSLSIQTNVNSLVAQENLRVNGNFQAQTIHRLTSGYRINSAADDAAGLAVANGFRSSVAELTQGVRNANDGLSQLQIIDGGVNNISKILDRMKTLATESASTTFTGDRTTLNNEYQSLITEVNRQAANVGLNTGGQYNANIQVYIGGGGNTQSNSSISVDLSGAANAIDATGLGVSSTNLLADGTTMGSVNLNAQAALLTGTATGASQTLTFNLAGGTSFTAKISSTTTGGITVTQAVQQLNGSLSQHGLSASVDSSTGFLKISGDVAFTATAVAASNGSGVVGAADTAVNKSLFRLDSTGGGTKPAASFTAITTTDKEILTFASAGVSQNVTLDAVSGANKTTAMQSLNSQLASLGISAVLDTNGNNIAFQSASDFTVDKALGVVGAGGVVGVFAASTGGALTQADATNPTINSTTTNSLASQQALSAAVSTLGLIQGRVGAGENKLNYAISLAQSQITNFSAAESRIRDTDVAEEAANLTKAQVLQQASIAAMAQANSAPQQVLSLLRG